MIAAGGVGFVERDIRMLSSDGGSEHAIPPLAAVLRFSKAFIRSSGDFSLVTVSRPAIDTLLLLTTSAIIFNFLSN